MRNDYIIRKLYVSFVVVSILSALTATAGMLIDNIVVGRFLGSTELGAMGIIGPVSLIFSAFGNICSGGGTARASQALGKGDQKQVNRIFTTSILYVLVVGVLLTVVGLLFSRQIAGLLGAKGELLEPAVDYLRGYFLGAVPTLLTTALMGFVKIDGSPRLPLLCIVMMSVCNIILDLLMVLVFQMGMLGMALATSISYTVAALTGLTHFLKKDASLRLVLPAKIGKELAALVTTGAPTAINRICSTVSCTVLNNLLVTAVGIGAVTAMNVRTTANNFFGSLILGLAQASVPIIAMFYGEESKSALHDVLKTALKIGLGCTVVVGCFVGFFAPGFVSMLGVGDSVISQMAVTAVRFLAVCMPFTLLNMLFMSYYQSTRSTGLATLICVLESLAFNVLFSLVLIGSLGALGVWTAFLVAEVCTALVVLAVTVIKNKSFPKNLHAFLRLPEGFGGAASDRLELSVGNSMDEVMELSKGIVKFGKGRDISERTMNQLSLAIEEMAGNVIQHAFKPNEKRWFDLMILDKPDSVVVRLRDNGAAFDPTEHLKNGADGEYGIRMIAGISKTMEYRRMLGLNTLLITLEKSPKKEMKK